MYAGVDPSLSNTGVVVLDGVGTLLGAFNSKSLPSKVRKDSIRRLRAISDFVVESIHSCTIGPVEVGYEAYSFRSTNKPFTIGELGGVLKLALVEAGHQVHLVEPTRLKSFAVDFGLAGKEAVVQQALTEEPKLATLCKAELTDDVCDAYFLAKFAWYKVSGREVMARETYRKLLRRRLEIVGKKP